MEDKLIHYNAFDDAWLGVGDTKKIVEAPDFINPLLQRTEMDKQHPGLFELRLMRNPEYLAFAAKVLLGVTLLPEQSAIIEQLWTRAFPMFVASRGFGKSWLLAVYCMLKLVLTAPKADGSAGCKIVIVGAAFRQSKVIFEYMENIWRNAPIYRSVCSSSSGPTRDVDRCTMRINSNEAIAIPIGDGSKIRGLRASIIIADEFASINPNIYETVISGFAAVSADPLANRQEYARREALKKDGKWSNAQEAHFATKTGNQAILSGTADYGFTHFAQYWRKYCAYIKYHDDKQGMKAAIGDIVDVDKLDEVNPDDYIVIRFPFELIPKGVMDEKIVARAKATMHSSNYLREYAACFPQDSDGFFKRSLIESCVAKETNVQSPYWPSWCPKAFDAVLRGDPSLGYVIGIDPASESDNFAIVVLEIHPTHQRVVYCWTMTREDFTKRRQQGLTDTTDFYGYCAKKIRELIRLFPLAKGHPLNSCVGLDSQGGGVGIIEALHDKTKIPTGEVAIWPIINPDKESITDNEPGLHIVEMINFADAKWTSDANNGLRKDLEDKILLFPRFDSATLELSLAEDKFRVEDYSKNHGKKLVLLDTLEDCVLDIEELKNELTTIVMSRTGTGINGRDRWDTPEIKHEDGRKGRLRKDRYSALLIANMLARQIYRAPTPIDYSIIGGIVSDIQKVDGNMYEGPEWFTKGGGGDIAIGIVRR